MSLTLHCSNEWYSMQDNSNIKIVGRIIWYLCHFLFESVRTVIILTAVVVVGGYLYGIRPYVVVTGSMQPTIMTGSVCFVNERIPFNQIHEQDIIAFRIGDNTTVTHRAIKVENGTIFTQGDANNVEDASQVTENNFIGKTIFWIPEIGKYVFALRTKRGIVTMALFITGVFLCDMILSASDPKKHQNQVILDETEEDNTKKFP